MAFITDLVAIKLRGGKYEVIDQLRDPDVVINPIMDRDKFFDISDNEGYIDAVKIDRFENFDQYLVKKDGVLIKNKTNDWFTNLSKDTWAILMNFSECEGEAIYAR
jgi:hypothetical protein